MPHITQDTVRRIANLAQIALTEEQTSAMAADMAEFAAFADTLAELDTTDVPITTHAVSMQNVFREDAVLPRYDRQALLALASEHDDECYTVPRVLD